VTLGRIAEHYELTLEAPAYCQRRLLRKGIVLFEGTPSEVWGWLLDVGAIDWEGNPIPGPRPSALEGLPPAASVG